MKTYIFFAAIASIIFTRQDCKAQNRDFGGFKQIYPIGDNPSIQFMSNYKTSNEHILFEANPIVRFAFYSDIIEKLYNNRPHAQAYYVALQPQWRMYTDSSLPVKMPSFQVRIGTQHIVRGYVNDDKQINNFWTFSFESGHYSNGQQGSSFSSLYTDGSPQGDSIYTTITDTTQLSRILNRKNGNFSTDITEIYASYRFNKLDGNYIPKRTHAVTAGITLYHDKFLFILPFGGFSDDDIKLYGRIRFHAGYEFIKVLQKPFLFLKRGTRYSLSENIEIIAGAHPSVNPYRSVTTASLFPFNGSKEFGFYITLASGHDNYNYRFVDKGTVICGGIMFHIFPPFAIKSLQL